MKRTTLAAGLLVLAFASIGVAVRSRAETPALEYGPAIAVLERFIEHEMADKALPALSIALVDDQRTMWARGFGFTDAARRVEATDETVYRVGSVSKLFTDIAVMQLVERGEVDLDAPVARYLPDFRPRNPFGGDLTVRQLMTHRSGLVPPLRSLLHRRVDATRALAYNLLGAIVGGVIEYSSMAFGVKALYLFAALIYAGALLLSRREERATA